MEKQKPILERIRKRGDFNHSVLVLQKGHVELMAENSLRKGKIHFNDFLLCQNCYSFHYHRELYRRVSNRHFNTKKLKLRCAVSKATQH